MDAYNSIVERNPFGLKDPVVAPPPTTTKPPPEVKKDDFFLTGISTIGDPRRPKAYLLSKDASKKEYDQKYYTLMVGDKQGDVEVKEIDPKGRRVLIAYLGEDKWLSMKDNGVPAPTGPSPAMHGGMPLAPGAMPPAGNVPMPLPTGAGPGAGPASHQTQPTYPNVNNRRIPRSTMNNSAANYGGYVNPGVGVPTVTPGVPTVTTGGNPVNPTVNPAVNMGPQTDAELIEQIAKLQNPSKFGNLPPNIPEPPVPRF